MTDFTKPHVDADGGVFIPHPEGTEGPACVAGCCPMSDGVRHHRDCETVKAWRSLGLKPEPVPAKEPRQVSYYEMPWRSPHPSHRMGRPFSTTGILTGASTPRFLTVRECEACGADQARSVCGEAISNDLTAPCSGEI